VSDRREEKGYRMVLPHNLFKTVFVQEGGIKILSYFFMKKLMLCAITKLLKKLTS
jgi:hypothetical protein